MRGRDFAEGDEPKRWWCSAAASRRCAGSSLSKYIKSRGYKIGTLVAFSGEVNDSQSGPDAFTETSKMLNPGLNGRAFRAIAFSF